MACAAGGGQPSPTELHSDDPAQGWPHPQPGTFGLVRLEYPRDEHVPTEKLSPREAVALYRARWQIELVFNRWKSLGLVAELTGTTAVEQLVRLWSRLLAVVVQHWLLLASVWQGGRHSLTKASEAIRHYAPWIGLALADPAKMIAVIQSLGQVLKLTTRQPKRKRATTFQLLNDVTKLEYSLT